MSQPDTKERILDAAEQLFGEHGPSNTSLRAITAAADANLAAVNYHFGSKEKLIEAVLSRRLRPVNQARLERLDDLEARGGEVSLEDLLSVFLRPALELSNDPDAGTFCTRLVGRMQGDPSEQVRDIFKDQFKEVAERFLPAFAKACPHLDQGELMWRVFFVIGAMAHVLMDSFDLKSYTEGLCDPRDVDATTAYLVHFAAAALRAPATEVVATEQEGAGNA
ncbi:MAG: TetR/AcrR family transcriptional regulator [Planctomycetota bacterium]